MTIDEEQRTKNKEQGSCVQDAGSRFSVLGSPFDAMAADYDRSFTESQIGALMRQAVWRRLDARFRPGDRVLELNCGTGEDAVYLARRGVRVLATDIAPAMLEVARAKVARAGLEDLVEMRQLAIEELAATRDTRHETRDTRHETWGDSPVSGLRSLVSGLWSPGLPVSRSDPFDGALSNFGGLNCVADVRGVADGLANCLRPGGWALLCVMGPLVPWEWAWYLRRGQPAKAFRRLRRGGVVWRGLTIRYPSIGAVRRAFAPAFRLRRVSAVGALVPPSYAESWALRRGRLLERLGRWERRLAAWPPLPWLADHYLLELERQ
jgi:SAM-dependent methyltransferase